MKNTFIPKVIAVLLLAMVSTVAAKEPVDRTKTSLLQKAALQEWKFFDGNTILCTINSAGPYCDYLRTNSSGLFWPRGTSKTAVFTAGMWVIGRHRPTGLLRTAVQDYSTEFQPGPILGTYNTTLNNLDSLSDPTSPEFRLYKINKKDSVGGVNPDYDNWPGHLGAPYEDRNGNGKWDAGVDKPKFWGDQQLWCVYNDGNTATHAGTGVTNPMGIEIQTTYFGFDQPGAVGNIMFMRWKVINKSDADYDSTFISMWSDTDLGDANDDMAAIDTTRKLGYVYNGDNDDAGASGYGTRPPANGFVFFQGPMVAGAPTDSALFEGKKRGGFINMKAYSHAAYINGGVWQDPPLGSVLFAEQAYRYQNGLIGATGQPYIDPVTNQPSRFVFPGDPVTETGWTQTRHGLAAADVRSMISAGPFTLAKGDTQEIVGGFVIAQSTDRLKSIELLRTYVDVAQEAFDVNFNLPSPPPQPTVVIGEMSNEVILNWGDTLSHSATESYRFLGAEKDYRFEGYNIYQLAGPSSAFEAKLLATYDLTNGVTTVFDSRVDEASGQKVTYPSALGTDAGVRRHFVIDRDFMSGTKLVNGKRYYFAVTSYAYNHDPEGPNYGFPNVLENSKTVMTIIPRTTKVGDQLGGSIGDMLLTDRAVNGDDAVTAQIINPKQLTGLKYEMAFVGNDTAITAWSLYKYNASNVVTDTMVKYNTNFAGGENAPIVDGIQWKVRKPVFGPRRDTQTPNGANYTPVRNQWFTGKTAADVMDAFSNGLAYPTTSNFVSRASGYNASQLKKVEIRFGGSQKAYRYLDANASAFGPLPVRHPSFLPFIKHRGPGGQYVYQDFVDVPFTVWEVDQLDGSPAERQLNVGFLERNDSLYNSANVMVGLGRVDGQWRPTLATTGGHELLFIFGSTYHPDTLTRYTRVPTDTTNNTRFLDLRNSMPSVDVMYGLWVRAADTNKTYVNGDKFTITPNYPLIASRTFSLTAPKNVSGSTTLMKDHITRINVFPNPYFGNNKAESNVYQRFVTFTNLPDVATIRIFNLAGDLVNTISHANTTGFERWDLRNTSGLPVASGMYIAYIEVPGVGNTILKLAVIQPEERPSRL